MRISFTSRPSHILTCWLFSRSCQSFHIDRFTNAYFNSLNNILTFLISLWFFTSPVEPGRDMDRAAIAQLSLYQLRTLIFLCLQEFGIRLGVQTNEDTVFRVSVGSVAPGDPIGEAVFPAPGTPPLPRYLCVHRCSRCWRYCQDQNPSHTEHLCPNHASESSTHSTWWDYNQLSIWCLGWFLQRPYMHFIIETLSQRWKPVSFVGIFDHWFHNIWCTGQISRGGLYRYKTALHNFSVELTTAQSSVCWTLYHPLQVFIDELTTSLSFLACSECKFICFNLAHSPEYSQILAYAVIPCTVVKPTSLPTFFSLLEFLTF